MWNLPRRITCYGHVSSVFVYVYDYLQDNLTSAGLTVKLESIKENVLTIKPQPLGQGGFGVVQLAYHKKRSCWYAMKKLIHQSHSDR